MLAIEVDSSVAGADGATSPIPAGIGGRTVKARPKKFRIPDLSSFAAHVGPVAGLAAIPAVPTVIEPLFDRKATTAVPAVPLDGGGTMKSHLGASVPGAALPSAATEREHLRVLILS